MTVFKSIIAWCRHGGIGLHGGLPWTLKGDLARFARITKGNGNNAVLMGRKTWLSLPVKPLKGRHNIVLSRELKATGDTGCTVFNSMDAAERFCIKQGFDEVWVIGGADVYEQAAVALPLEEVRVTEIEEVYSCDTYIGPNFVDMLSSMKVDSTEEIIYTEGETHTRLGSYVNYIRSDSV